MFFRLSYHWKYARIHKQGECEKLHRIPWWDEKEFGKHLQIQVNKTLIMKTYDIIYFTFYCSFLLFSQEST